MRRVFVWLAQRLRPFVEKYDPITTPQTHSIALVAGQQHYRVTRTMGGHLDWVLYDGPNDQDATKWWDHVKSHKERGRMEFWHNGALRDTYTGP